LGLALSSPGGWTSSSNTDLSSTLNQQLTKFTLETLSESNSNFASQGWTVAQIYSIQTQVVAGTNYKMKVELVSADGATQNMTWIVYYEPWTNTIRLIDSFTDSSAKKADIAIGGYTPQSVNTNDPALQNVISTALATFNTQDSTNGPWKVDQVLSVSTQVVAGVNYKVDVILTNAENQQQEVEWVVFTQPWTNTYTLVSSTPISTGELRNLQIGGWTSQPADMNDIGLKEAVDTAMSTLKSGNGLLSTGLWSVSQIISVQTQVVAGVNYQILAEITNQNGESMYMLWEVNEIPWENSYTLTSYQIVQPNNLRRLQVPGGAVSESPNTNDPGIGIAVKTFLSSETEANGLLANGNWTVSQILSVSTQVVAGMDYNIQAELINSDNNATMVVEFTVWEQSWTNTNTVTSATVVSSSE
jgi:uncharacterized protein (DUF2344 family)